MQLAIESGDRKKITETIHDQRSGFLFSYTSEQYQLHVVDRLALYPLFYTIHNSVPQVSQIVDELLPLLKKKLLHPEGFYGTGGPGKGNRSIFTPFDGILRIPPGHFLEYRDGKYEVVQYWSFNDLKDRPFQGTYEEACDRLGHLIKQAVDRCYAHSPNLAVHLSGGIDSGSITALLAQSKKDTIHAYSHVKPDAPDQLDKYESGYIKKYVDHYPNISVQKSHTLSYQEEFTKAIHPFGNWHNVSHDTPEGHICQDLTSKKTPYLLSGVGGDELASFGHGNQKSRRTINNDAQARRFMYREMYLIRKLKFIVKGILGMDGPRLDSFASSFLISPFTNQHKFYNPSFRAQVKDLREGNLISLYWFPSSYNYRLETLSKTYFMIRSDKWNYLSKYYGIDYLFPLVDTDLIEFCASLPRKFFIGKAQRNMIKTGLKKYIPAELLTGGKRPGFQAPNNEDKQDQKDIYLEIKELHAKIEELKLTLAASVYDLNDVQKNLLRYTSYLDKIPASWKQTKNQIKKKIKKIKKVFVDADYINSHFDGIAD